ncbi:MAG: DEAD/DEAH box helicase family protein [Acidimicrobiia bacterium]
MPSGQVTEQNPIVNDPYAEPTRHWQFGEGAPVLVDGRRSSGYLPPGDSKSGELSVTGELIPLDLVNDLRDRVARWRADNYPGATAVTRDLFDRWFDDEREPGTRPFFAQQEAVETVVFLTEAPADRRVGIGVPRTEAYERWAVKMATGTGKTLVMAMLIAWSSLNKSANAQDTRFADAVLVVCPNLTVKERLAELDPHAVVNAYKSFDLVPPGLSALLGQAKVLVTNWHQLAPATDPKRSVQRLGEESPAAFCRRVIEGALGRKRRILVLNDEAHHAYRHNPNAKVGRDEAEDVERATVWIDGLERIHIDREILRCIDLSATPMYVPGSGHDPWKPFEWIVSDFALVDAIESGLVKVPRIPVDDNAGASVPKYRNLWTHVKANLPKRGDDADEGHPLTDYLTQVDGPLKQLAGEWQSTFGRWQEADRPVPPAMIVICNDTKMAEILEVHVGRKGEAGPGLANSPSEQRTIRIDSKLLADAERRDDAETATEAEDRLRRVVATVGKVGEPGEQVRCLISVAMLSEGWDARNVTQILGLRAFASQLLCEQVVGRGLRRSSYDDLGTPEYVDVYGVPFQMLPFANGDPGGAVTTPPKLTSVVARRERAALEIRFPRVVSIVHDAQTRLIIDWDSIVPVAVKPELDPTRTTVSGLQGIGRAEQDREWVWESYRRQKLCFEIASRVIRGQKDLEALFPQAVRAVEEFVGVRRLVVYGAGADEGELDNELYKTQIAERLLDALRADVDEGSLLPVLDEYLPEGTTADVAFQTGKPDPEPTVRSHVNYVVCDSELERHIARELEADDRVESYVKNDHLFCEIPYRFNGKACRYLPDFLVRLGGDRFLLVEGKGRQTSKDDAKETAARRWVAAVNADGRWGDWSHHVVRAKAEVRGAIDAAFVADVVVTGSV